MPLVEYVWSCTSGTNLNKCPDAHVWDGRAMQVHRPYRHHLPRGPASSLASHEELARGQAGSGRHLRCISRLPFVVMHI